jgi:hypothetical protein
MAIITALNSGDCGGSNLDFIGKLRVDADLRYLYTGEQKKRGAPRKYDGKLDIHD